MTRITDSFQRLNHPRVASIGDASCSICLESHHRHLVGDHVMKLTGDPRSLVGYCSIGFFLPIALGSLNPLLYALARGPTHAQVFSDVITGTSSPHPKTPLGQSPAGGAAQPGFDLATGFGSLRAGAFAAAVASRPIAP